MPAFRPDLGDQLRALHARCESPAEQKFLAAFLPLKPARAELQAQVPIEKYRTDFLLTYKGKKLVIEIDGRAYHAGLAQEERDHRRNAELLRAGYEVIRVWASDVERDADKAARKVLTYWKSLK